MKKYLSSILICILIIFLFVGCSSKTQILQSNLNECINDYSEQNGFSGVVLIAQNNSIILNNGYGMANVEKHIENTAETIFRIGSLTKQFTSIAILMLEEDGLLSVNDTINKYVLDYPRGEEITIHNLLTHTSGVYEYTTVEFLNDNHKYYYPEEIIETFKNEALDFEPGEKYQYCNSNYILLGYIIEKVSGMSYKDFINERIIIPLDMKNTGYDTNKFIQDIEAIGYSMVDNQLKQSSYIDMSIPYAAGALFSTVEDLYKWEQALFSENTENTISKEIIDKMVTPHYLLDGNKYYGYGVNVIKNREKIKNINHYGNIFGFSAYMEHDLEKDYTIIILSNIDQMELQPLIYELCNKLKNK